MKREGGALLKSNCVSDELLINAPAMCLAPASYIWFPK